MKISAVNNSFSIKSDFCTNCSHTINNIMNKPEQKETNTASLKLDRDGQDDHTDRIASVRVEHEVGEHEVLIVPPDTSKVSRIHKLTVVDLWSDDTEAVEQALTGLASLCEFSNVNWKEENPADIHGAGAASAIVGAMKKWYTIPDIQVAGCSALANTAAHIKDFRLSAKNAGGLEVVVCAMQNYSNNCDVQSSGCAALGNLCTEIEEHAAHIVNTMKGHDIIIVAMKKFPVNARVQRWACYALSMLSIWQELRPPVCDAGGRRALAEALETHKDESKTDVKEIQELARLVLQRLLK
jgi:hypothetical protein